VCEGKADAWFFHRLFEVRKIESFDIDIPLIQKDEGRTGAGSSCFGEYLRGLRTEIQLNPGILKAIIIESDNEADPQVSLEDIRKQIMDVGDYGVPEEPYKLVCCPGNTIT
jgi:hypothetical protein